MPILQVEKYGEFLTYRITVPKKVVEGKSWKKGDDIGFAIVDEFNRPLPGDIYLRKNR